MPVAKLVKTAVAALEDIKAHDITVLDVRKLTSVCDTMVIASVESGRQARALAQHLREAIHEGGGEIVGVEGEDGGEWVLVDAGSLVVHVMQPVVRAHYNLEELWTPASLPRPSRASGNAAPPPRPRKRAV